MSDFANGSNGSAKKGKGVVPGFISPQKIGETLQEVSAEVLETESEPLMTRWFHSDQDVDVFYWVDSRSNVIKQQVSLFGQVVEWNILEGVRTGLRIEVEESGKTEAVTGMHYDQAPLKYAIGQAIGLLSHAHRIHEKDRNALVANFEQNPTMEKMDVKEFYQRFGKTDKSPENAGFFEKLKKWLNKLQG